MLETVVIVAAGVVTVIGGLVATGRWLRTRYSVRQSHTPPGKSVEVVPVGSSPSAILESLRQRLRDDFCIDGPHTGEFVGGKAEDRFWQGNTREEATSKPSFYLTYWGWRGIRIMHESVPSSWAIASTQAITRRLGDGHWIQVQVSDYEDPTSLVREVETVRHTIRGAEILMLLGQQPRLVSQIAWSLLDEVDDLTSSEGGWYEFRGEKARGPSLYASLYAFHFLATLFEAPGSVGLAGVQELKRRIRPIVHKTESFLLEKWTSNARRWGSDSVPWEIATPVVLAELTPFTTDAESLREPVRELLKLVNPSGRLNNPKIGAKSNVSEYKAATRIAYGLHCCYQRWQEDPPQAIANLNTWLISEYRYDRQLSTCEIAFLATLLLS